MRRGKLGALVIGITVLALLLGSAGTALAANNGQGKERVIVMFEKTLNELAQKALLKTFGVEEEDLKPLPIINGWRVMLPLKAKAKLMGAPGVLCVEADATITVVEDSLPWGVDRIDAEKVWGGSEGAVNVIGNAGAGVDVAIIDTGIDYTHPDLDGNYKGGYDFVNSDDDPIDDHGHGTHVAGIVAAEDDGEGVIGVAPKANLWALKVLDASGSGYYSDLIAALDWCVTNGIEVANMSLGGTSSSSSLKTACTNAYEAGVLLVAAAGNSSSSRILYPAKYDSVIAVSATDRDDKRASFSNYGKEIELAAPGVDINSTLPGGGYGEKSGTSMSTPHVSGVAALVISGGFATGSSAVRDRLDTTAEDLGAEGRDKYFGYGLVDAEAAAPPPAATGSIGGTVSDASSTESPIEGATVTAEPGGYSTTTATDGTYTLSAVPVGTYTVTASAIGYVDASQTVEVLENQTVTANFALVPQPTGTITGKVTDAETLEPIANATVTVDGYSTTTADNGTYTLANLPVGTYTVTASATGYSDASQTDVEVLEGQITVVDFQLTAVAGNENDMYVWSIDFSTASRGSYIYRLYIYITIKHDSNASGTADAEDAVVSGAMVDITLKNLDTGQTWTGTGASTNSNGVAGYYLSRPPKGTYQATVTSVTHATYTWNSALDAENPSENYKL